MKYEMNYEIICELEPDKIRSAVRLEFLLSVCLISMNEICVHLNDLTSIVILFR